MPSYSVYIVLGNLLLVSGSLKSSYIDNDTNYIRHRRQFESNGCILPPHPENGRWILFKGQAEPGETVDISSIITFECKPGYRLSSKYISACLGQWSAPVPECEELCPPLYSSNTYDLECTDKRGTEVNCNEATHGTNLEYTCKTFYETSFVSKTSLLCENGKWDQPKPVCEPVCGKKVTTDTRPLSYGSKPNDKIEHPWVAAIYTKINDSYENICGGSVLSQTVIVTAAHCVTDNYGNVLPKEDYVVGVGKLYRRYLAPEDTRAQYLELLKIIVPEDYKADIQKFASDIAVLVVKEEISINHLVQPVCFTNMKKIHLHAKKKGEVSGWGLAEGGIPSEILRTLVIPYKNEEDCVDELSSDWADRYKLRDKICAGFVNKSTGVCTGDSGAGLVFKYREDNRYYIHGIVSVSQQIGYMCNIQQNALYTSVAFHYEFVDGLLTKYAPKIKDCVLPPYPENGKWISEQGNFKPGDHVPSDTILKVKCNDGFIQSSKSGVECSTAHNLPVCEMACSALQLPLGTYFKCRNREGQYIDCSSAVDGSSVYYSCPPRYKEAGGLFNRTCTKGSWGLPKPECIRECGKKVVDDSGMGSEYPWNAAVYQLDSNVEGTYKYICGGSVVSKYVVVTAAQCITDESGEPLSRKIYLVAAGKQYREYNDSRDTNAQISNIIYINVHPGYKETEKTIYNIALLVASTSFDFNNFVQPVCVTEFSDFWLNTIDKAYMIGWSATDASPDTVKSVEVVNKPNDACVVPTGNLKPIFFYLENKCIGFMNESYCALPEDRGKGVIVKRLENDRYYLQAVTLYYENVECQKNFLATKASEYSDTISCSTSRL